MVRVPRTFSGRRGLRPTRQVERMLGEVEVVGADQVDRPGEGGAGHIDNAHRSAVPADRPQRHTEAERAGHHPRDVSVLTQPGQRTNRRNVRKDDSRRGGEHHPPGPHLENGPVGDLTGPTDAGEQPVVQREQGPLPPGAVRHLGIALEQVLGRELTLEVVEQSVPPHGASPSLGSYRTERLT